MKKKMSFISNIVVNVVMLFIGAITMILPGFGFENPTLYTSILFFVVAFFSFGGYFFTKEKQSNYELLFFSVISMFSGAYLFVCEYTSIPYVLGSGFLIFVLLAALNKIYHIDIMKKENNILWILRTIFLILMLFLSTLTIQNFYREVSVVQTMMVGYYFISYAFIYLLETVLLYYIKPSVFEKIMNGDIDKVKKANKLKNINKINENVDELDEIVKKIEPAKRKNKKAKRRV